MASTSLPTSVSATASIRNEISRFESVHPSIYAIYELLDEMKDDKLASVIRHHLVLIEDSFVKSQEWSLARTVREIRIGVIGCSAKSALVHGYLTGSFSQQNEQDSNSDNESVNTGGRFKKLLQLNSGDYLLLVREDGSSEPDQEFLDWIDGLIIVTSSKSHCPYGPLANSLQKQPICLVNIDKSTKFHNIKHDIYYEVDISNGTGVDIAFSQLSKLILEFSTASGNDNSLCPPTPIPSSWTPIGNHFPLGALTPTSIRKSGRRRSNLFSSKNVYKVTSGRTIPSKQGQMWKKSSSKWKKKYVILTGDCLIYYSSLQEYMAIGDSNEDTCGKVIPLAKTSIKATASLRKSESLTKQNISTISLQTFRNKNGNNSCTNNNNNNGNVSSHANGHGEMYGFTITNMENKLWEFEVGDNREERDEWVQQIEQIIRNSLQCNLSTKLNIVETAVVRNLQSIPGNDICADCSTKGPDWASLNLGILICISCSGVHRNLGTEYSRVRSLDLDEWSVSWIAVMTKIGNTISNSIYEEILPSNIKPSPNSSNDLKAEFIQNKYKHKKYVNTDKTAHLHPSRIGSNISDLIYFLVRKYSKDDLAKLMDLMVKQNNLAGVQLLIWSNANTPREIPSTTDPDIKELLSI